MDARWDVAGRAFRPTTDLAPGIHFWRVLWRRGEVAGIGTPWVGEFAVPGPGFEAGSTFEDYDGDGLLDHASFVQTGTPPDDPSSAFVRVHFGAPARAERTLLGPDAGMDAAEWGGEVRGGGDLDADGYVDVTGSRSHQHGWFSRAMVVFRGASEGPTNPVWATVEGSFTTGWFLLPPPPFRPVGDRDGDGFGDLVTDRVVLGIDGRMIPDVWTLVRAYGGPHALAVSDGAWSEPNDLYALVADLDGDGRSDAVSQPSVREGALVLYVSMGASERPRPGASDAWLRCEVSGPAAPFPRAEVADEDLDGYDDIVLRSDGPPPAQRVAFHGSATGLPREQCVALPSPPTHASSGPP